MHFMTIDEILSDSMGASKSQKRQKRGLKALSEMDLVAKSKRYPHVPAYAMPKSRVKDSTANQLTQAILKWLQLNGHYCSRIQSQGQYQPGKGIWTRSTVKRGIGDVMAIVSGKTIMIEVKVGQDKQSKWQTETQKEVEQSGGLYFIAKEFDSFLEWYKTIKK